MPASSESIRIRRATANDARRVFEWRNDPYIVERSSSQRTVNWEEHLGWFEKSLRADDARLIFIVEKEAESLGLVRFDREGDGSVISVYLLERFTGRGFGIEAIRLGCRAAVDHWPALRTVMACVRDDNLAGSRGFEKAGFRRSEDCAGHCPEGHIAFRWENL